MYAVGGSQKQANCPLSELSKHITTKKTRVTDYAVATKKGKKAKKIFNQNFETMVQAHWDNLHEEIRHQLEEVGGNSGTKEEESIHRCVPVLLWRWPMLRSCFDGVPVVLWWRPGHVGHALMVYRSCSDGVPVLVSWCPGHALVVSPVMLWWFCRVMLWWRPSPSVLMVSVLMAQSCSNVSRSSYVLEYPYINIYIWVSSWGNSSPLLWFIFQIKHLRHRGLDLLGTWESAAEAGTGGAGSLARSGWDGPDWFIPSSLHR